MTKSAEAHIRAAMMSVGFDDFRSTEQESLIYAIYQGSDALGILPTGSGKSACFIIPTLARGIKTVVISPLIALMSDQVSKLREWGIPAYSVTGETEPSEIAEALLMMLGTPGKPGFLYASPEMLASETFRKRFRNFKPALLAIDEAHCVSTWGDTFRPSYLRLREIAQWFGSPQCVAFSATIDKKIEADICKRLPLKGDCARVVADPYRSNLTLLVERPGMNKKRSMERNRAARQRTFKLLQEQKEGAVIVYCYSRDRAASEYNNVKDYARRLGYTPLLYHAQILPEDKDRTLHNFMRSERPLVFCTNAFGMGIDRSDVRLLVHFDAPGTLIDYAQQIGRAGRDGLDSRCIVFYDPKRVQTVDSLIRSTIPDISFVERIYHRLVKAWRNSKGTLSLVKFQRQTEILAGNNVKATEVFIGRLQRSLGILRRAGLVNEVDGKLFIKALKQENSRYLNLIELTEMSTRRQAREVDRLRRFFEHETPDQALLWQIIGE